MNNIKESIMRVLFPPRCVFCGEILLVDRWEAGHCVTCKYTDAFIFSSMPKGAEMSEEEIQEPSGKFAFSSHDTVFSYDFVKEGILSFKFHHDMYAGKILAGIMVEYLNHEESYEFLEWAELLVAVPLHPSKKKKRGFNQVDILCAEISAQTGICYEPDALERVRDTIPQSDLTQRERRENISGAFLAQPCEGKQILLLDDIFTTGNTVNECARALRRMGAKDVRVLTLSAARIE